MKKFDLINDINSFRWDLAVEYENYCKINKLDLKDYSNFESFIQFEEKNENFNVLDELKTFNEQTCFVTKQDYYILKSAKTYAEKKSLRLYNIKIGYLLFTITDETGSSFSLNKIDYAQNLFFEIANDYFYQREVNKSNLEGETFDFNGEFIYPTRTLLREFFVEGNEEMFLSAAKLLFKEMLDDDEFYNYAVWNFYYKNLNDKIDNLEDELKLNSNIFLALKKVIYGVENKINRETEDFLFEISIVNPYISNFIKYGSEPFFYKNIQGDAFKRKALCNQTDKLIRDYYLFRMSFFEMDKAINKPYGILIFDNLQRIVDTNILTENEKRALYIVREKLDYFETLQTEAIISKTDFIQKVIQLNHLGNDMSKIVYPPEYKKSMKVDDFIEALDTLIYKRIIQYEFKNGEDYIKANYYTVILAESIFASDNLKKGLRKLTS